MSQPYLSVVVSGRNDDYGGHFLHRFTHFLDNLSALCERHALDTELIVVEWNPVADRPRLAEVLDWPRGLNHFRTRLLTVSAELHARFEQADRIAFFEFHAKNAGIRRAAAPFVLSTNADVLPNEELIAHLAQRTLRDDRAYRISRWDIEGQLPADIEGERRLRYCAEHVYRTTVQDRFVAVGQIDRVRYKRWWSNLWRWGNRALEYRLYTCAAGDFTLMSADGWSRLRGYPQVPSMTGLDGFLLFAAVAAGLKQHVFAEPMRLYHQDHQRQHAQRLKTFDYDWYRAKRREMLKRRQALILNDEQWGLGDVTLPEQSID